MQMLDEFEYSDGPVVFLLSKRSPVGAGNDEKFFDILERKYLRFILNALYLYIIMYI